MGGCCFHFSVVKILVQTPVPTLAFNSEDGTGWSGGEVIRNPALTHFNNQLPCVKLGCFLNSPAPRKPHALLSPAPSSAKRAWCPVSVREPSVGLGPGALLPLHKMLKLAEVGQRSLRAFRRERKVGGDFDLFLFGLAPGCIWKASGKRTAQKQSQPATCARAATHSHAQPRASTHVCVSRIRALATLGRQSPSPQAPVTCCRASQRWSARSSPDAHGTPEAKPRGRPVCTHCTTWVKFTDSQSPGP